MTTKPQPLTYATGTSYGDVSIETLDGIKTVNGERMLDGGSCYVRISDKPDLAASVAAWEAEWQAYLAAKATQLEANVPGLDELRAAQEVAADEEARHYHAIERMMEDEHNDGARPPRPLDETLRARAVMLAEQYPRAAIYLLAERYTRADNVNKVIAGREAMEVIATGGEIDAAKEILDNWSSKSMWD